MGQITNSIKINYGPPCPTVYVHKDWIFMLLLQLQYMQAYVFLSLAFNIMLYPNTFRCLSTKAF